MSIINENDSDFLLQEQQQQKQHHHQDQQFHPRHRPSNPLENATFLSRCSFAYIFPLLRLGKKRPIEECDLPELDKLETSTYNRNLIENIWEEESKKATSSLKRKRNLARALFWYYMKSTWMAEILMTINMIARIGQAVMLGLLMEQFGKYEYDHNDHNQNDNHQEQSDAEVDVLNVKVSYLYAALLILCGLVAFPTKQQQFFQTYRKGVQLRLGLVSAVYSKTLRLPSVDIGGIASGTSGSSSNSSTSGSNSISLTSGHVTNLVSNDVERFLQTSVVLPFLIQGPFIAILILVVGIVIVGPVFATGYGLLLILVPFQTYLGRRFAFFRSKVASLTDDRVTMVSQAVSGVRVMKMNAWELEFEERISKLRSKEVSILHKASQYRALNEAFYFFSATVVSAFIFIIDVLIGGVLTPRKVYTTLTLIGIIQFILTKHLPSAVMGLAECYVSCNRIQAFLELSEQPLMNKRTPDKSESEIHHRDIAVLSLKGITCHWKQSLMDRLEKKENEHETCSDPSLNSKGAVALSDISYTFKKGNLYCIIGRVGCGKSALLQAIAGELPISCGLMTSNYNSIAYAAQDPWIMDGSVRENIIMGLPLNEDWYSKVIEACVLGPDIAIFKDGDLTIVGDRGVQCSGGQRARIGLARAMYCDADVYLLDDPLSAVDAKVARSLYDLAIQNLAVKREKCVILVTHQTQFVGSSNCILMDKGKIITTGSLVDCVKVSKDDIHDIYQLQNNVSNENVDDLTGSPLKSDSVTISCSEEKDKRQRKYGQDQAEKRDVGIITMKTWRAYGNALGGSLVCFSVLSVFAVTQCSLLLSIVSLGKWAEVPANEQSSIFWLVLTVSITGSVVILSIFRAQMSFFLSVKASQRLHDRMLHYILRAKIEFFDTNPLGRILNRFSADVGIIDETFPYTIHDFIVGFFVILGSIATAGVVLPFILLVLPPLLWYFLRLRTIFVSTSRELKRLEGIARSPIYAMVSESLNGIATIRSNSKVKYFKNKFEEVHNAHTRAYFAFVVTSRWFAFQLDILSFLLMSSSTILSVLFHNQGWFDVDSAILGLALTLLIQISTTNFPWVVRQSAEVSNQMVSVERIVTYGSLPSEAALEKEYDEDLKCWPESKSIKVQNLTARYRSDLPSVLQNVSFEVKSGQKLAVVGRTGSGKSSLVQVLFRILEPESGSIQVGGIDISLLGLHKLRNAMSVIPQSPVLFSGCTVQENLDPFGKCADSEVIDALKTVQMMDVINNLPHGVNTPVAESGSNFSVGQRQLLCLARAILCKSQILILDEPTANVDTHSDKLIQKTLRDGTFSDSTIIMVAHRLQTISDFDCILVLGDGAVLEVGAPQTLLSNKDGHFSSMVRSASVAVHS